MTSPPIPLTWYQYATVAGDGTGSIDANGDYSTVQGVFAISPAAGEFIRVYRMLVLIQDTGTFDAEGYGALAGLTNGVQVRVRDGNTTVEDLTAGNPITSNAEWGGACYDVDVKTWGVGDQILLARWTFERAGYPIRLDGDLGEELQIVLDDNLTGLVAHRFMCQGYIEGDLT